MRYPTVLHVIPSLDIGGAETQLVDFIRHATRPDAHVVAVFDRPGRLANRITTPVIELPRPPRSLISPGAFRTVRALRRCIDRVRPDIVHAHLDVSTFVSALAVPRGVPLVSSRRGFAPALVRSRAIRLALAVAHCRTTILLCNSDYLRRVSVRWDVRPPPITVIMNAVDLERFTAAPPPGPPPTVLVVSRMIADKGLDVFVRAFLRAATWVPDARAVIVGDGPERARITDLLHDLGLERRVQLIGEVDDVRPYLAETHVVALASRRESFPNALLEAMAAGRPVVATSVGGVPELVLDGENGRTVPPDDADAFGDALTELLGDLEKVAAFGRAARATAERHGWDTVVARTEAVYRSLVERADE